LVSSIPVASHLVERINLDFEVQNSIVPSMRSMPKFKVHGRLPNVQIKLSDAKYQSLMRVIDSAIPRLSDAEGTPTIPGAETNFAKHHPLFSRTEVEYDVENDHRPKANDDEAEEYAPLSSEVSSSSCQSTYKF
jgi:vacuolar protein sorting-associated protein 13A/C